MAHKMAFLRLCTLPLQIFTNLPINISYITMPLIIIKVELEKRMVGHHHTLTFENFGISKRLFIACCVA